jgi:hypothetical protein
MDYPTLRSELPYGTFAGSTMPRRRWGGFHNRPGDIYAAYGNNGLIKLGCSHDAYRRVQALKNDVCSVNVHCELIARYQVTDMAIDERLLHWLFKEYNIFSEWFDIEETFVIQVFENWIEWRSLAVAEMPESFSFKLWRSRRVL